MDRAKKLKKLQDSMGIYFENQDLLNQALTHPTYVFENRQVKSHNQRLEFLGDAVLGMIVAGYLYKNNPRKQEGYLTKLRAVLVCETALSENAKHMNLGSYLLLGKGEALSGGRDRRSILADAYEALVGAIYLDLGLSAAQEFVTRNIERQLNSKTLESFKDHKTLLQELIQKHHNDNVSYAILDEHGPDHDKLFFVGVYFKGKLLAKGKGKSKKEAEQRAAKSAFNRIRKHARNL